MKTKEDKNIKKKPASGVKSKNKKKPVKQKHPVQKVRQPLTNAEFLQVAIIIGLIIFFIYCSN